MNTQLNEQLGKNGETLILENEENNNGLDIFTGEGLSDIFNEGLVTDANTYKNILCEENQGYVLELYKLFVSAKEYLELVRKASINDRHMHEEEELLLNKLVSKIGVLSNHFERDTYKVKTGELSIHGRMNINFKMKKNCVLAPGCLPNLNKLIMLNIINQDNIDIDLGSGVNLQEGISFFKTSGDLGSLNCGKFEEDDILERISIKTGKDCSFPHGVSFFPGKRNDIVVECGEGAFLGINSLIGSGTKIGDYTTIWWGTQIGNNVELGNNVIVGQSSTIDSNILIPDNCLIPNFSKIKKGFTVVEYDEYENNPNKYEGNYNYVIRLSENKNKVFQELNFINPHYNFINRFNLHNVVPENKIFAAVDTIFSLLTEKVGFQPINFFQFDTDFESLKQKFKSKNIPEDIINKLNFGIDGKSRVVLKAFTKNVKEFMLEEMLIILGSIIEYENKGILEEKKDEILSRLESLVDRPTIINQHDGEISEDDLKENFFGDSYITGKFGYSKDSIFVDLKSRGDELNPKQSICLENVAFIRGIIHGGGNKFISNSNLYDVVAHGGINYRSSHIGEIGKKSVLNACDLSNSSILGDATINGSGIDHSVLFSEVSIAGGSDKEKVIIQKSGIGKGVCINIGTEIYGKMIGDGEVICKNIILTAKGISGKR